MLIHSQKSTTGIRDKKIYYHKFLLCINDWFLCCRKKYGIDNFEKFEKPKSQKDMCYEVPKQIPPYNGYGSYEDSLGNCFSVEPKAPPTIDFEKFMKLDKYILFQIFL